MLKYGSAIISRRYVRVINKVRLAGTVIRSNPQNRQILMETKTIKPNHHKNLRTATNFKTDEKTFVNILDDSIVMPQEGDRVTVDGLLKRVNFCDSSFVKTGEVPIMERSLSRLEVYTKDLTVGAERDINHVVLGGYIKSVYENVDGLFGSNGLVKMSFNKGPMMFICDGVMTNTPDRFPHGRECYHQYMDNRDLLIYRIVRKRDQAQRGVKRSLRETNHQYVDNLPVVATGVVANVISAEDELDAIDDPVFQSRVWCFSLSALRGLKTPIDSSCEKLYQCHFKRIRDELVFPDYDVQFRKHKEGDDKKADDREQSKKVYGLDDQEQEELRAEIDEMIRKVEKQKEQYRIYVDI